ncbi:MAG: phage holin family protein [Minisyncoccia bacterium]
MKFISRLILHIISNAIALFLASHYVQGFIFNGSLTDLIVTALLLTLANIIIRPILKLIFGPLIFLTLGAFTFVINVVIIYLLDIFVKPLTIEGYGALIIGTLFITVVNFIFNILEKGMYKK